MGHDAECDPIVLAGVLRCRKCGRIAFPTDAARLSAALIIATYSAPCGHARSSMLVIDLEDDPPAVAADPALSLYVPGRRCAGRNRFGRPCGNYADPGSRYCHAHQSAGTLRDQA